MNPAPAERILDATMTCSNDGMIPAPTDCILDAAVMCGDDIMHLTPSDRIPDATVTIRGDGLAPCCVCGDPVSPDQRCRFCYA
jgi:hypothetical protein